LLSSFFLLLSVKGAERSLGPVAPPAKSVVFLLSPTNHHHTHRLHLFLYHLQPPNTAATPITPSRKRHSPAARHGRPEPTYWLDSPPTVSLRPHSPSVPLRDHLLDAEPALWTLGAVGLVLSSAAFSSTSVEWEGARLRVHGWRQRHDEGGHGERRIWSLSPNQRTAPLVSRLHAKTAGLDPPPLWVGGPRSTQWVLAAEVERGGE
jgi:hypothetical protein